MSSELVSKDEKIKEIEKLYMEVHETLMKQPSPEIISNFEKTQKVLRERGIKMKVKKKK